MTPDFALILSHDTVRLLHRAADGWYEVGEADIAADDLDERLAMLRRTATSLARGGLFCKIVLPDSLIRYLEEAPEETVADPADRARRMLDGATPYSVEDLVFDVITTKHGQIHVAAVARETLQEAEAFAVAHRFNPVVFAGRCADQRFPTEPDFGPTSVSAELLGSGAAARTDAMPVFVPASAATKVSPEAQPGTDDNIFAEQSADESPADDVTTGQPVTAEKSTRQQMEDPQEAQDAKVDATGDEDTDHYIPVTFARRRRDEAAPPKPQAPETAPAAPEKSLRAPVGARIDLAAMHDRSDRDRSGLLAGFLAAVVVVALGTAALWATGMIGRGGLSSWLNRPSEIPPDAQFASPPQPTQPDDTPKAADLPDSGRTVGSLAATDAAIQEALSMPVSPGPEPDAPVPPAEQRAEYAVTGIWPVAPVVPRPPALVNLEDLYTTSIDPVQAAFDAVALPAVPETPPDLAFLVPASPAPAGTEFALNDRGFVVPAADGAMNPDGILVFAGPPPLLPPENRPQAVDPGQDPVLLALLSGFRPKLRPGDLIETTERASLSGLTRAELAQFRPKIRPPSAQENATAGAASLVPRDSTNTSLLTHKEEAEETEADGNIIAVSLRPEFRPSDFGLTVARAQQQAASTPPAEATVTTASVAPRAVVPTIPSSASASRKATQKNAINLRRVNLIGVYGKPSDRRALVRLGNGRYQKVEVGDRIDGGRVSAIGDSELRYQKSGRNIVLKMPRG